MSQKSGPGWVRGTGRRDCPVGYPIKGNEPSNLFYEPGDPGYPQVIPEMCFEDVATAVKVGFTHVAGGAAAGAAAAAAAAPAFVRHTGGSRTCPDGYPIKGNEPSNVFYRPEDPGYAQVVPEVCFADVSEAEKAGFSRVKVEATKRTEPVAPVRKEEAAAAAAGAAVGAAAAKSTEPVKAAEAARVAAPPPPPPPPPPPAPVAEASGGGWMKWLLPLLALAVLAALIWYFTRDDNKKDETPTPAATVAATIAPTTAAGGAAATVEGAVTGGAATVESAASTSVSGAAGTIEAVVPASEGTIETAAGTAEAVVPAAEGTVEAAAGTVEAVVGSPVAEASPVASPVASPSAGGVTLHLEAKDIAFDPTELTINAADEPVTIQMENTGAALHDFTIDSLNISVSAQPGETVDIVIPAGTAPGTYDFYCNVPGHKQAGMVGTLIVK